MLHPNLQSLTLRIDQKRSPLPTVDIEKIEMKKWRRNEAEVPKTYRKNEYIIINNMSCFAYGNLQFAI